MSDEGGLAVGESAFDLSGRAAVVTGGARGFGRAFARGLAHHGADVAIFDLDLPKAREAAGEIAAETGRRVIAFEADVSSEDHVNEAFRRAHDEFGRLDVLVNNAGVWSHIAALDLSLSEWDRVLRINLTGTLLCSLAAARLMIPRGRGSIVNIASISGELGFKQRAAYATTKHGVRGLTKSLANEWAAHGVRVNAIGPGAHNAGMAGDWRGDPAVLRDEVLRNIPMGRLGDPEELLGPLILLASDASSYMTGQTLFSDGGWLIG